MSHPIDSLIDLIPAGWTLANLSQQDDKSWFCELREGYLTSYGRVVMSETRSGMGRPRTPSEAIEQCFEQFPSATRPRMLT
jgi:hypothetical protein